MQQTPIVTDILNAQNITGIIVVILCFWAITAIPRFIKNARRRMSTLVLTSVLLGSTGGATVQNITANIKAPTCPKNSTLVVAADSTMFSKNYICVNNSAITPAQPKG
jgi:uncharacterized protein YacL